MYKKASANIFSMQCRCPVRLHRRTQTNRALEHCQFLCYNRMYFKIKATASTYIRILIPFFFALPVSTFMIT